MIDIEDIKRFLPQYLSSTDRKALLQELSLFPENIDKRFYTSQLQHEQAIFQGDGISDLNIVDISTKTFRSSPCFVISNSCDNDTGNKRIYGSTRIVYAPIVNLGKYRNLLVERLAPTEEDSGQRVEAHLADIRRQRITQIFYLPPGPGLTEESLVFLDTLCSCSTACVTPADIPSRRLFSLSDYGFYVLLFKLSVHFTRIQENIPRNRPALLSFARH